jgi:hypothetical protein
MRFMLLLKGDPPVDQQGHAQPPTELIEGMLRYNEELTKAGVLLAAEGLHPSSVGARVVYSDGRRRVVDGPFTEAKELIAGFYLIQVKSKEEAIEWAKRCPVELACPEGQEAVIEVRLVGETEDLSNATPEQRAAEQRLRDEVAGRS